jgi:hypothetical protein
VPLLVREAQDMDGDVVMQKFVKHPDIAISGIIDLLTNTRVLELKFCREFNTTHAL